MPYKINPNIRIVNCEKDLVILDIYNDSYHIINDINIADINKYLSSSIENDIINSMVDFNWINVSEIDFDQIKENKLTSFFDQRWMVPLVKISETNNKAKMKCFFEILKINTKINKLCFRDIIFDLNKISVIDSGKKDSLKKINIIIKSLNSVFIFDLSGNKCLAYSYILTKILRKFGFYAKLKIGIRTRPFLSHAWVEVNNIVINDEKNLNECLVTILEI